MNEETETQTPEIEEEETSENQNEEETSETPEDSTSLELKSAIAQKEHFRAKFEKAEKALNTLKAKPAESSKASLDVEDYIDISASLEGLDQREKERVAREHKLSGRPIKEIRQDEDFTLWQKAYREKVETEKLTLKPSGTQPDEDRPMSLEEALKQPGLSFADKEQILKGVGLYKENTPRKDRVNIPWQ